MKEGRNSRFDIFFITESDRAILVRESLGEDREPRLRMPSPNALSAKEQDRED